MAVVYYKFRSEKDDYYKRIPIYGNFISVGTLKQKIFESQRLGIHDYLLVVHASTNQEYVDEAGLIPKYTSLIIHRLPRRPRFHFPIVAPPEPRLRNVLVETQPKRREGPEWNVFGGDLYETSSTKKEYKWPKEPPPGYVCHKCFVPGHFIHHCPKSKRDYYEDSKNKAIMECRPKVPPQGYLCDRCKVPGHNISRCPTNGNPKFDMIKRVIKPPPPASTSNGNNNNLQEIILCPLCNHVMKDAAQTKCCFRSFCDKCIREYINRFKSICVCGANIVEDDIMPNRTLREAINRMVNNNHQKSNN